MAPAAWLKSAFPALSEFARDPPPIIEVLMAHSIGRAANPTPLPLWKRLISDSQLNPYARRTSLTSLRLRTRLLIAAVGWLLLLSFFWIALSHNFPQWVQAAGWALLAAWLLFASSLRVRSWKNRIRRERA